MFHPQVDYLCCTSCLEETDGVPFAEYESMPCGDGPSMVLHTYRVSGCCDANLAWVRHTKCARCTHIGEPPDFDAESGLCQKCFDINPELEARLPVSEVFEPRPLYTEQDIL